MTMITLDRPKRATASLPHIADWWAEHAPLDLPELRSNWIGWGEPFCFACGWLAPVRDGRNAWSTRKVASWLDRAHLVDHCQGGGGQPDNLVPLCHLCHDEMPPFGPGQRAAAALGVQSLTVRRYISDGTLYAYKLGQGRRWLVPAEAIRDFIEGESVPADPLAGHVAAVVAAAPKLTDAQRDRLAGLLRPVAGSAADRR